MNFIEKFVLFPVTAGGTIVASLASILSFLIIGDNVDTLLRASLLVTVFSVTFTALLIYRFWSIDRTNNGDLLISFEENPHLEKGQLLKLGLFIKKVPVPVAYLVITDETEDGFPVAKIWDTMASDSIDTIDAKLLDASQWKNFFINSTVMAEHFVIPEHFEETIK